ncbi:Shikimate kinase 1 [Rhizobium rhizogenes]|uniref:Shikimate kinase n=2 Tax=Rhizobium/Agrobacterium group TaxID=227290 RepID=A0A546Y2R4_AGRTU|nr:MULTISPECIES: shikimate kinase [Rhizobium/Agrobacterium group]AQS64627.1 shikimate kinase [Rhizobium rhizogenes]MBO0126510.1 shikimate kinase [Agrobacterium sp. OT33]MCZ7444157.1 shikimate kinase [Rhizobium rhizogenes]NSX92624.1 shikimate kinase [Agrobacterium tumefaciens]NSZ80992.1 shikimate kinase [Agrobacterium tumefaciens]
MNETNLSVPATLGEQARAKLGRRNVVFVGLMGAGKSAIGRMVAQQLKVSFIDTDVEIERVSRMTISELFATYGEEEFRALETRVIKRLLRGGPKVISTGGGAFINDNTRRHITRGGISLWLKADLEVLWERVNKRDHRPLLKTENPKATLAALMEKRYPIYAEADLTIESRDVRKEIIVTEVLAAIAGIEQKDRSP